jgi:hypothetical protein
MQLERRCGSVDRCAEELEARRCVGVGLEDDARAVRGETTRPLAETANDPTPAR